MTLCPIAPWPRTRKKIKPHSEKTFFFVPSFFRILRNPHENNVWMIIWC